MFHRASVTMEADENELQGDSLRVRLRQSEIARLRDHGAVEESVSFQSGATLVYRILSGRQTEGLQADFDGGLVTVHISADSAQAWASSDEVGVYAQNGGLRIAIEKDFRCLMRAEDEPDAFPRPAQ
jgi:hypothetical protein